MSKATITISDNDDDTVNIKCTFKPDIVLASEGTPAQLMAFRVMHMLNDDPDRIRDDDEE